MILRNELEYQGGWLFKYRSYFPLIILLFGFLVFLQPNQHESFFGNYKVYFEIYCLFVSFIGLGIRVYTIGYSAKNTSGRNTNDGQIAESLNCTGIYSIVRHPLYLGNFFMWLGLALFIGNLWFVIFFVLFYWIYYERIIFAEEQFLEKKFSNKYTEWASKTPTFIPNIFLFKKSNISFSIKKVLKQEKNGLFALFLIFCFFDIIEKVVKKHEKLNYIFIIGCVVTMLLYVVLKVIKQSRLLDDGR
ncbi:lipid A phosphate methyltransferase [Chryseobacterium sp. CH21]|uniref:methyltransferase family protein n=1 Tax=Chryseobacterium sp. CH21 TaxID=713556 RepID=UPI00100B7046|nr:isoprenylcysteine carboxylmethyltransferase family protein [Chryseobacterium sp. CH21]RXM40428.1 lipid A phosphate methyltransferase [Chryseobacterium sp. CH21]